MLILPFNDPEQAIAVLDEYADQVACILIDPIPHRVGMVPVAADFLRALKIWASENGVLLMFDEVITFRSEVGGMQARYDVAPDLTSLGKILTVESIYGYSGITGSGVKVRKTCCFLWHELRGMRACLRVAIP